MAGDKTRFLTIDPANGGQKWSTPRTSSVSASAGEVVGLNASGLVDASLLPGGVETVQAVAVEDLLAGDFVHFYDNVGTREVEKADASDPTKPCNGYILAAVAGPVPGPAGTADIYIDGENSKADEADLDQSFEGKYVYLYGGGGFEGKGTTDVTEVTALGTPYLLQKVGILTDASGSPAKVAFLPQEPIEVE